RARELRARGRAHRRHASHRARRALLRRRERRARARGRLLLPRGLSLRDGRTGVSRIGVRGVLDAGWPDALGAGGQAAVARGRIRCQSLAIRRQENDMEASTDYPGVTEGEGYAVSHLDDLGDGPGFRKVRKGLGVTAFGVNAIVLPPGIETGFHFHDVQEELYFVHRGTIEMEFGDGAVQRLQEGGLARVDAATPRKIRNTGDVEAVYLIAGGKDGYIGRDGRVRPGEEERVKAVHELSGEEPRERASAAAVSEAEPSRQQRLLRVDEQLAIPLVE